MNIRIIMAPGKGEEHRTPRKYVKVEASSFSTILIKRWRDFRKP